MNPERLSRSKSSTAAKAGYESDFLTQSLPLTGFARGSAAGSQVALC